MPSVTTVGARNQFSDVVNRAAYGKERVILTRRGKPIVAMVPIEDVHLLEELEDRIDLDDARAALEETRREGTVPWEQIKADLGL
ncbi:MAG: type II toxin-antitoxin system Phd/YefM family antitoxin [Chloroflexi bacterium]|nr:type II toxin-antitoxin system Phd/YefM family antitoxin [Chloroflexota bacterium]